MGNLKKNLILNHYCITPSVLFTRFPQKSVEKILGLSSWSFILQQSLAIEYAHYKIADFFFRLIPIRLDQDRLSRIPCKSKKVV